jgi:predicted metal-dependent enzyme (double-stranded beta helix superfamily)
MTTRTVAEPLSGVEIATLDLAPTPHHVLEQLAARRTELLERVRFDDETRWHARLSPHEVGTDAVEVWLLSWLPGQESPLHDHGGSAGSFTVLQGALDESVVDTDLPGPGSVRDHLWTRGVIRSFGEHHVHRVGNDGHVAAVSLHAYRPALLSMRRFVRGRYGLERVSTERAGSDW